MARMRRIAFTALALLLAAAAAPADRLPAARAQAEVLRAASGATVRWRAATGVAGSVRLPASAPGDLAPGPPADPESRTRDFFAAHGAVFGLRDAATQLDLAGERSDPFGFRHLTFRQFHRGVPVFAGELRAHFDPAGRLREVAGIVVPGLDLEVEPFLSPGRAAELARAFVARELAPAGQRIFSGSPRLTIWAPDLGGGPPATPRLAWEVEAGNGGDVRARVFVDDRRGKVADHLSLVHHALDRRAFSGVDQAPFNGIPDSWPLHPDWVEGDPQPTGLAELDGALAATADVHRFFAALGVDSYDGDGHVLDVSWNHATFCPNASWNGMLASFCSGFAVHDVVAHEWAHAWSQYSHGLIYRWESGALSESFSDIWGEVIDDATRLDGVRDTDGPDTRRADGACSAFEEAILRIASPASLRGDHEVGLAAFGAPPPAEAPGRRMVRVLDGAGARDACEPVTNGAELAGAIAFADRGDCDFQTQARHVQQAGAAGLVIGNLPNSPSPEIPPAMGCDPVFACDSSLGIPTVSVAVGTAEALRAALAGWVGARILRGDNEGADESVRWLLGEDVRPYGLVRDMWTPTCFGDPGKVSDSEYFCGTADGGGVHTNSGVPNHAFALLVEGGTYNGRTVGWLGRTRAIHVYWRAQQYYQTPATDFADHAVALESACDDLIGLDLPDPFGGNTVRMTAGDCAKVEAAVAAVELRQPNACGYAPILASPPPAICPAGDAYTVAFAGFEAGTNGWTASRRAIADPESFDPRDWTRVGELPDERPGSAYFAPDPRNGDCVTGLPGDDDTGVLVLESPLLTLPIGLPARFAFDHWIASEARWDGGNLRLSVDGGPFAALPVESYLFNPPNGTLLGPELNTNPLAGEAAFHGTDEGSNSGSWGRSIVDLAGRVAPGQPFRLRFEFGTDLCFGSDLGWYVDDLRLAVCAAPAPLFLDGFETATVGRWSTSAR